MYCPDDPIAHKPRRKEIEGKTQKPENRFQKRFMGIKRLNPVKMQGMDLSYISQKPQWVALISLYDRDVLLLKGRTKQSYERVIPVFVRVKHDLHSLVSGKSQSTNLKELLDIVGPFWLRFADGCSFP